MKDEWQTKKFASIAQIFEMKSARLRLEDSVTSSSHSPPVPGVGTFRDKSDPCPVPRAFGI